MTPLVLAAWLAVAASGPEALSLPGFRLHLQLSDAIDPDALGVLARPGVVLWLETRANLLKRSLAERLGRAEASYVQLRPPLGDGVRQQFFGHVHPWVAEEGLDVEAYRRWAPGGTAVDVVGTLTEERFHRLQALHPLAIRWQPQAEPAADEWVRAGRLAGLEVHSLVALPACERPFKGAAHIRLRIPAEVAESAAAGCGFALRLEVPATMDPAQLRALLIQFPGAELWADVEGEADTAAAAALVRLLTAAVPPAPVKERRSRGLDGGTASQPAGE